MLGHVAVRYFTERGAAVLTSDLRYDPNSPTEYLKTVVALHPSVVINALGIIKHRLSEEGAMMAVNGEFPIRLREALPREVCLVQPSTDCVFRGDRGDYEVDAPHDASDEYGKSKSAGERVAGTPGSLVVRASIIGPEVSRSPKGLLGWLLSHADGETVPGYVDHRWNGITTLEWCRIVEKRVLRAARQVACGVIQPACEGPVTKCELLKVLSEAFGRRLRVAPVSSGAPIDRTLRPTETRKPIGEQATELASWYRSQNERA